MDRENGAPMRNEANPGRLVAYIKYRFGIKHQVAEKIVKLFGMSIRIKKMNNIIELMPLFLALVDVDCYTALDESKFCIEDVIVMYIEQLKLFAVIDPSECNIDVLLCDYTHESCQIIINDRTHRFVVVRGSNSPSMNDILTRWGILQAPFIRGIK